MLKPALTIIFVLVPAYLCLYKSTNNKELWHKFNFLYSYTINIINSQKINL